LALVGLFGLSPQERPSGRGGRGFGRLHCLRRPKFLPPEAPWRSPANSNQMPGFFPRNRLAAAQKA
jgi:hypothetical protein